MSASPYPAFGIPRWDQPLPEEHPAGLMLRLAQINRFRSVAVVERETGIAMSDVKVGRRLDELASLVASDLEAVSANAFVHGLGAKVTIRGEEVSLKWDFRRIGRRVCPACLSESPHARFWWDLAFVGSCPRHGCLLEDRCNCATRGTLSWRDGRLAGCLACDEGDLSAVTPAPATEMSLAVDGYLLGRLQVAPRRRVSILDALPLYEAVDMLERVGALSRGGYSKRWPNARSLGGTWNDLLAEGFSVLAGHALGDVLDRVFEAGAREGAATNLTNAYGWFYHWLNGKGGRAFSEELTRAILTHAEERFVVDKRARAGALPEAETCTLVEAARLCGVSQPVVRDILEQRGLIDRQERVKGRAFHIAKPEIDAVVKVMRSSLDLNGVRAMLGTSHGVAVELMEAGLLTPFVKGGRRTKHDHIFLAEDVRAFLDRLGRELSLQAEPDKDGTTLTNAAHAYAVPLAYLCKQVVEGHLSLTGRLVDVAGLPGFLVRREDALIARRLHRSSWREPPAA